jgi:hypothetical protein
MRGILGLRTVLALTLVRWRAIVMRGGEGVTVSLKRAPRLRPGLNHAGHIYC